VSDGTAELNAALAKAQAAFPKIKREKSVNTGSYSYSYASLDAILEATRKPLSDNGLALVQLLDGGGIRTELRHSAGGVVGGTFPLPTIPERPQDLGSMLTYLRRYAVVAILGIAPEEDDDGASAQREATSDEKRSAAQNRKIFALIKDLETLHAKPWPPHASWKVAVDSRCHELYNHGMDALTKSEASTLIENMTKFVRHVTDNPPVPDTDYPMPSGADQPLIPEDDNIPFG